ncbi:hypothetical protein J19TS2_49140 [Cohnella xylanilytica]|nr:hypothetical protein J19TS2_49140 [Cohnella xylanilytica]
MKCDVCVKVTWIHDEERVSTVKFLKFRQLAKRLGKDKAYIDRCIHGFMTFAYSEIIHVDDQGICMCCFVKQMKDEWDNLVKQAA